MTPTKSDDDADAEKARRHAQVAEASRRARLTLEWFGAQTWDIRDSETSMALLLLFAGAAFTGTGTDLTRLLRFLCEVWETAAAQRHLALVDVAMQVMQQRADDLDDDDDDDTDDDLPH